MKHLKHFNKDSEYVEFRDSESYIKPNVSYCENMKHVHYNYVEPMSAGSFYYSDGTYSNELDTNKNCIGVCVIPKNFLPDGKARIMSLKEMDYKNPESGSLQHVGMYWGQYEVDTELPNLDKFTTIDPNAIGSYEGTTIGSNSYGYVYLSSNRKDEDLYWKIGEENNIDKGTHWNSNKDEETIFYIPSPYMKVNGKDVLCPEYNSNATSDFDGKGNTDILTSLHTVEDWKTVSKITNEEKKPCYPAAVCCARYKTEGTNSGDWYLPTIGELGFIMPRFKEIQGSFQTLGERVAITLATGYSCYWSSLENDSKFAFCVDTGNSALGNYAKNYGYPYVRAFLMV